MANEKAEVLVVGLPKAIIVDGLRPAFTLHLLAEAKDKEAMIAEVAPRVRGVAVTGAPDHFDDTRLAKFPKLELVSSFGVGYDNIGVKQAVAQGVIVTHTPDVLNEEVADTAIGLLLCTIREFPQADRFVRAGRWTKGGYPLSQASLRDRSVGIVGLGRIGKAIARRLEGFQVPISYHSRKPAADAAYRYYPNLVEMARDVDTLIVITPGGPATRHLISAEVLAALGPRGIVINLSRGSVVDDAALIAALKNKTIHSAGLDVFVNEPEVPPDYLAMDNIVLFPHLGSASVFTRRQMEQLVVDNLLAWNAGKPPLTPVPETPWPPKRA